MRISSRSANKLFAVIVAMLLATSVANAAPASQQQGSPGPPPQNAATGQGRQTNSGTESSTTGAGQPAMSAPDPPQDARPQTNGQSEPAAPSQTNPGQQQNQNNENTKPVGTAVAPYEKTVGVAASRPAGAVIAPPKQRRRRIIFVRVAIIVGAGVAIGTVMALSHASPSRPQ